MPMDNAAEKAIQKVEVTEYLSDCYLSGIEPTRDKVALASGLNVSVQMIKEMCEVCYDEES